MSTASTISGPISNTGRASDGDIGSLLNRIPPHSIEAESAVLGSLILDQQMIGDVIPLLHGRDDFYQQKHAAIYEVLLQLYDQGHMIDMVHLTQQLRDLNLLETIGGVEYLLELAESVPSATSAVYYARIVRDKAVLRNLIDAAGKILYEAHHSAQPVRDQLDVAEQAIFRLAETGSSEEAVELSQLLQELYHRLETQEGQQITGLDTGFIDLNNLTSGLQNGEMIIIAGRPSMGKTAFALNIAEHISVNSKQPIVVFSLEMSKQQLAQRLLCSRSGVDSQKVRRNMLSSDDFAKLSLYCGELSDAPLLIDDTPGLTLLALRAKARRMATRHNIKAVVVDYLQLMTSPGSESRQQEVSDMSRGIKAMARELNVPVVCLSQLNRGPESREGHRPRMSDLRESGSIEQDADVIMMLHREDYYHQGDKEYESTHEAELIIAKQRNGPTATVKLLFNEKTTRFNSLSTDSVSESMSL